MAVTQDRIQKLRTFGLTDYQARVYLALLEVSTATAAQIPALSRVPRTRIYETMQQLHAKGLVQILPEKPLRYKPVPFSGYLKALSEDYRRKAQRLSSEATEAAQEFTISAAGSPEERGRFEAIYGRRNIRDRLVDMYEHADSHIIAIGSLHSPARILHGLGRELEDRAGNGVHAKLAFCPGSENEAEVQSLSRISEVRRIDFFTPVDRHGVDGRQFLMSHPIPDDDSPFRGEDIAIWTDDPAIAGAMDQMAERLSEQGSRVPHRTKAGGERRSPRRVTPLAGR